MKRNSRIEDSGERMTSFVLDAQTLNKFKSIITREGKSMKVMIEDYMKDYNKIHDDGNPQFLITQFDDPNFMACPAFYRDSSRWEKYCKQATPEELEKVKAQILLIEKQTLRYL